MSKIASIFAELGLKKDKFDKGMSDAGKQPSKLGAAFASAGTMIATGFMVAGAAAVAFGAKAMEAYDQQAKAEAGLLKALKGREDVQQALIRQAGELQRQTLFGDETTVSAQKMLAQMGLAATQIADLTPLVQDFATAMNMDLANAANLVGKAIGTGTNALGRYGVELDATMSKADKAIAIQKKFTEMFGGQAKAAADVGISGLQQLKGAWGDIMEVIGAKIGPFMSALAKIISGKMLDAAGGGMSSGMQKVVDEYLTLDANGREKMIKQYQSQADEYRRLWEKAKVDENKELREHYSVQYDLTKEAIDKMNSLSKEGEGVFEPEPGGGEAALKAYIEQSKKLQEIADINEAIRVTWNDNLKSALDMPFAIDTIKTGMEELSKIPLPFVSDEENVADEIDTKAVADKYLEMKQFTANFVADANMMLNQFTADLISGFAEGLGDLMTGDIGLNTFFNNILGMFGQFIQDFGKMLIGYGIAWEAFKSAPGPLKIAAGIALIAIGKAISNMASKSPASGGGGGYSTSGMTGGGGYSMTGAMPRYNSAEEKLVAEVSGDSLRILLDRSERTTSRRY